MPKLVLTAAAAAALAFTACVSDVPTTPPGTAAVPNTSSLSLSAAAAAQQPSYLIDFTSTSLPADLDAQVRAAGGTLTAAIEQIGVAVARSADPGFADRAARIGGVHGVAVDPLVRWIEPPPRLGVEEVAGDALPPPEATASVGAAETFRLIQWAPDAIAAPAAWDAGATGASVRVAILDGGIHSTHIDIAPNLDVARSKSFVPNQPFNFDQRLDDEDPPQCVLPDGFWHGTHVAGIVAAPANNIGTVGIAPDATIIGVKVLHCGSGQFSWIIDAIVYAATPIAASGAGADVINLSLGAAFFRRGPGAAQLARVIGKATTYAYQQGVTVVAALGNDAIDLDHSRNVVFFPAMAPHVIAVSALGPVGWAQGATNVDRRASYTNFGQSAVDFAAPGGDFVLPGNAVCGKPRQPAGTGTVFQFCWAFDMVLAPVRGGPTSIGSYNWAAGTSMAAPAVSGVAALIIGRYGRVGPAEVERRLRQGADDLGKPGTDDTYGGGRVNALRAIQ